MLCEGGARKDGLGEGRFLPDPENVSHLETEAMVASGPGGKLAFKRFPVPSSNLARKKKRAGPLAACIHVRRLATAHHQRLTSSHFGCPTRRTDSFASRARPMPLRGCLRRPLQGQARLRARASGKMQGRKTLFSGGTRCRCKCEWTTACT